MVIAMADMDNNKFKAVTKFKRYKISRYISSFNIQKRKQLKK